MSSHSQIHYPNYLLDRSIVVNKLHEYKINSFKLATESEFFKEKIKETFDKEVKKARKEEKNANAQLQKNKRVRTKSISEIQREVIHINYEDLEGFKLFLDYCHQGKERSSTIINEDNFESAMTAGSEFSAENLIASCLCFLENNISISNSIKFWEIGLSSDEYNRVRTISEQFILKHFIAISTTEKFLNLSFNKIENILKDDRLNCGDEKYLLNVMKAWILFDKAKRLQHCCNFLKCIRLGQIAQTDLEELQQDCLIMEVGDECKNIIDSSNRSVVEYTQSTSLCDQDMDLIRNLRYFQSVRLPNQVIYVLGGWEGGSSAENFGPTKSVQIFNPKIQNWKRMLKNNISLDQGYAYSAAITHDNKIYLIGGYVVSKGPVQLFQEFDFDKEKWSVLPPMHEKRNYVSGCLLDGMIYAIGGHNGRRRLKCAERYEFQAKSWSSIPPMSTIRSDAGAGSLLGKIYVCGGFDGEVFHSSVEEFDPSTNQWTQVARMNSIRSGVEVLSFRNQLYALCGNDGRQRLSSVERYDPIFGRWTMVCSMQISRSNFCSCVVENEIYVIGGWSDELNATLSQIEKWNPTSGNNNWEFVTDMPIGASASCCCVIDDMNKFTKHL